MSLSRYWYGFLGIQRREWQRFWLQRARFATALVRPLLWLFVFAAGFGLSTGFSIPAALPGSSGYQAYMVPGLCGMVILFNSMQCALSMVYDRELGSMRILLVSPLPRPFLLIAKLLAMGTVSVAQSLGFLALARLADSSIPPAGYLAALPLLVATSLMLGATGLLIATWIKQLENFAGLMNFVIFPLFFLSSALYPLSSMAESNPWLYWLCQVNPFTHAVEAIRHALYLQWNPLALGVTVVTTCVLALSATTGFRPQRTRVLGRVPS
ncbi:multidrug ABC transporter permease [Marinobacter fuscus]|uniref:Transport permease protein n=1 Tax=Marinobacter fuscus TaxID=2109942 RepID=A0A2T1KDN6_9GAMM|nr:ABC transporter permease [Marinobacter fuscus]PSF08236.1 multidrug ABC transporter permease [Marinobacter fuscus]